MPSRRTVALMLIAIAACSGGQPDPGAPSSGQDSQKQLFPEVVAVTVTEGPTGIFRFDVTMSSPYDTPARYADAWRVVGDDGVIYGVRELLHDHASEQPFTRSLTGVELPDEVRSLIVQGRDSTHGWGGTEFVVEVP